MIKLKSLLEEGSQSFEYWYHGRTFSKYYDAQLTKLEGSTYGDIYHLIVYKPDIIQIIEKIRLNSV